MKKNIFRIFVLMLAFAMLFTSCGNDGWEDVDLDDREEEKEHKDKEDNGLSLKDFYTTEKNNNGDLFDSDEEEEEKDNIKNYTVNSIGNFYNGIAPVSVQAKDSWGIYRAHYSYIDTKGNLLFSPKYRNAPEMNGAVKVLLYRNINEAEIINDKGKILTSGYSVDIGDVSHGLYWVVTTEEKVSGNVHKTTYYNTDGKEAFSFDNTLPGGDVGQGRNDGTFSKYGYAIITTGNTGKIINTKGEIVWGGMMDINTDTPTHSAGNPAKISWTGSDKIEFRASYINKNGWSTTEYFTLDTLNLEYSHEDDLNFSIENIPAFQGAKSIDWRISKNNTEYGRLISVELTNHSGTVFYSVLDEEGNVLIEPQTKIILYYNSGWFYYWCTFSEGLCVAKDASTGKFGFINTKGEWVIAPTYDSAIQFQEGYATVNDTTVINTKGEFVLRGQK